MNDPIIAIRKLTFFLVISGTLNIILAALIFYWAYREIPPTPYFELKPAVGKEQHPPLAIDRSGSEVIRYFRRMPLQWLISRLNNTRLVENGYTQRDLALASLVAFYDFDLDRAFSTLPKPEQKRRIIYGQFSDGRPAELVVYPGLSEKHFEAVRLFAATERWPLTSRGLFLALQKQEKEDEDPSLLDAFFMTPEFSAVEMLFRRNQTPVPREELLKIILEGNWMMLSNFVEKQKASHDLSPARRQNFLLDYVQNKSKAAAQLMLKTDGAFAARKLDDRQVLLLLQLADEKSPQAEQFARSLLTSPRSDAVLKLSAERLYEYEGTVIPQAGLHPAALARYASNDPRTEAPAVPAVKPKPVSEIKPATIADQKSAKTVRVPPPSSSPISQQPKPAAQQTSAAKLLSAKIPSSPHSLREESDKDFYYTVQDGDTLWKIGRRFRVDLEVLRAFNGLENDALHPGMKLRIPKKI